MWRSFTSWVGYLIVGAVVIGAAWLLGTHPVVAWAGIAFAVVAVTSGLLAGRRALT